MLIRPCECRYNRKAAATCPRVPKGVLIWTPTEVTDGQQTGAAEVVALDGRREMFSPDSEWTHYSEGLARDWARVLHLDFKVATSA